MAKEAAQYISSKAPGFKPKFGLILGSGIGMLADHLQQPIRIPYAEIPGFTKTSVAGHSGTLCLGYFQNQAVACLQGRIHPYEGKPLDNIKTLIRTLKLLGCEILITTNAVAAIRTDIPVGSLFVIRDHINFQFMNPLVGENDAEFGPRFPDMNNAYDADLRGKLKDVGKQLQIDLPEGIFVAVLGPSYETPAEINAFRILGADVVGMSTVPEIILARHCGLKCIAISIVSNMAAGVTSEKIKHEDVLKVAHETGDRLLNLISTFIGSF
jgi:xanthosine phosphorylase